MQLSASLKSPAHQQDDLAHGKLSHRPRIRVRIIKHRNPSLARSRPIDLVDANAEGSHRNQLRSRIQYRRRNVSLGTDAQDRNSAHFLNQLPLLQRALERFDRKSSFLKLETATPLMFSSNKTFKDP